MPWPRRRNMRRLVLAFDGDEVDQAVKAHPEGLRRCARFSAKGQPDGTLYVSRSLRRNGAQQATRRGDSIGQGM